MPLLLILAFSVLASAAAGLTTFKTGTVTLMTASGPHRISVELATDEEQREQGLMFRNSLGKDSGMLFIYPSEQPIAMWMKNTLIPLDMLFVRADGTIISIHERAVPESLDTIPSGGEAKAALELNGGTIARLGIKPGDKLIGEGIGQ